MGYDKGGIEVFNKLSQTFTPLPIPSSDQLNKDAFHDMLNDHQAHIWITTSDGLVKYLPANNTYKRFTRRDGLASSVVFGLAMDKLGRLWLGSRNGISCFNIQTSEFTN